MQENLSSDIINAVALGTLSEIPFIGGIVSELSGCIAQRHIEDRLQKLERTVRSLDILMSDFIERIYRLEENEHKYYVVRNNLKFICLSALPETVDALNKALIEIIMKDDITMAEYACEIIKQLNADDILLLKNIKRFQQQHKTEYQEKGNCSG